MVWVDVVVFFFFFKKKTAYEMRISDWSSDVCSFDLWAQRGYLVVRGQAEAGTGAQPERVCAACGWHAGAGGFGRTQHGSECQCSGRHRVGVGGKGRGRSEERRVGKEGASTCRSRWSP